MRHTIPCIILLLLAALSGVVHAEEKKLTAKQARAFYEKADKALNEAWAAAKAALPESEFNELKEEQKMWVAYRDHLARSPMYTGAEAHGELSLDAPEYLEAAAYLAEDRTKWLKGLVREWGTDETLTGMWSDSHGGTIQIVEQDGKLHFIVECVRGPTSHLGGLAGIAAWNNTIGWFSDKGRDPAKEGETNLSFILRDRKLEIIGANTGEYHGVRAYFDGEYVKTGALNAKQQAKVVQSAKTGELPEE